MRRAAWLFVAPAGLFFLVLIAFPLLSVLWRSLQFASLTNPSVAGFAGLENFRTILDDDQFWPALRNTSIWTGLSVAGEYALGLLSAVALAQPVRGRAVFRGIIIIPWVIPIVVAGLDWTWMLTPDYGVVFQDELAPGSCRPCRCSSRSDASNLPPRDFAASTRPHWSPPTRPCWSKGTALLPLVRLDK